MNGVYNGNGDTENVINHLDPGMIRKDNSPVFSHSAVRNIGTYMSVLYARVCIEENNFASKCDTYFDNFIKLNFSLKVTVTL